MEVIKHRAGAVLRLAAVIGAVFLGVAPWWAHAAPHRAYARGHNGTLHKARRIERFEPFYGTVGGEGWPVYHSRFAVPACIVNAESHGLVHEHSHPWTSSGLYQITAGTWAAYGGLRFSRLPYEASKHAQSIVASRIWNHGRGASNWTTAYGCGY